MKRAERRKVIHELVRAKGQVDFQELKKCIPDVSDITIRRDLEAMDNERLLVRISGGAKSLESIISTWEEAFPNRMMEHKQEKQMIAEKAVALIEAHQSVFLDSGSTATYLAEAITDIELEIFTTGLTCAMELASSQKARVQLIGGRVNQNSYSINGDVSVAQILPLHFQIAFLGATGYIPGRGFVTTVADDYILKRTIVQNSKKVVIILDSSKEGKEGTYLFASLTDVDVIAGDGQLSQKAKNDLIKHNIVIL
jgi:DeoR family transcriptional regulator of aga operon